jgi:hypothetical protein
MRGSAPIFFPFEGAATLGDKRRDSFGDDQPEIEE